MATRRWLLVGALAAAITPQVIRGHNVQVKYDSSVNLTCDPWMKTVNFTAFPSSNLTRLWILPGGDILQAETSEHDRVDVLEAGRLLYVRRVDDVDFGLYYCLVSVNSRGFFVHIHGINVNGPYWGDLWGLKYRDMVMIGLVAAAVCFVTLAFLCFVYNRQQAKKDKQAEMEKVTAAKASNELDQKEKRVAEVGCYENHSYSHTEAAGEHVQATVNLAGPDTLKDASKNEGRTLDQLQSVAQKEVVEKFDIGTTKF